MEAPIISGFPALGVAEAPELLLLDAQAPSASATMATARATPPLRHKRLL
jgi:hypothetical protein